MSSGASTERRKRRSASIACTPVDDSRASIPEVSLRLRDALTCKVCKDWLDDPICLACGHALCRDCATQWFAQPQQPTCPTCRAKVPRRAAVTKAHSVQADLIAAVAAGRACCALAGSPAPKKKPRGPPLPQAPRPVAAT